VRGRLGKDAYRSDSFTDPGILALARKVRYHVDPTYPGPGRFKGEARITLRDGRVLHHVEEYNRGSAENPMSEQDLRAKFDENASGFLDAQARDQIADRVRALDTLPDASVLMTLATASRPTLPTPTASTTTTAAPPAAESC
jgi:2-methylcitrate dehydratase PrpD